MIPSARMRTHRPTVLILSSDPGFAREVTAGWPQDGELPEFVVLDPDLGGDLQSGAFDLAIADVSLNEKKAQLQQAIASTRKPAILVGCETCTPASSGHAPVLQLCRDTQSWAALLGLLGREILRRIQAESSAREAQKLQSAAETEATLGRYMSEMRHSVNNALTSVLGNSELLLLEPGLPANVIAQADTIRNMALRLHEVFQRFSSIEKELSVAARESGKKSAQARAAANGM
jgi:signal transduction histidine kinase